MRRIFLSAVLLSLASPVLASQCPSLWQQINEKMKTAHPSDTDQVRFAELRTLGEDLHHAGDHAGSEAALHKALALLD